MIVSRQNFKGGPRLKKFSVCIDPDENCMGFKLGYCSGCGHQLTMRFTEAKEVIEAMNGGVKGRFLEWMLRK